VEALNNLGNVLLVLSQPARRCACYRRALEVKPDDAQVLCNLGNALRGARAACRRPLEVTRRAISLAPRLAMAHTNNLGLLLAGRGDARRRGSLPRGAAAQA